MTSYGRPIIGITTYAQPARVGRVGAAGGARAARLRRVGRAGGRRARCSSRRARTRSRRRSTCSTGSSSPAASTSIRRATAPSAHPPTDPAQAHRDAGELRAPRGCARARPADARDLPRLPGAERRCAAATSIQHLPEEVGHEEHRETPGVFSEHAGRRSRRGPARARSSGARHEAVRSSHHQGVGRVGDGLVESAYADDGTLEALEDPVQRFALGVLWHPEMEADDKRLFEALVAEARLYRAAR